MTSQSISTSHAELLVELNRDPAFRVAYRKQKPYYDLIAEIIKRRKELDLSQLDLAQRAQKPQSTIARIESGSHNINFKTLIEIAEALETELVIQLKPVYQFKHENYISLFEDKTSVAKTINPSIAESVSNARSTQWISENV